MSLLTICAGAEVWETVTLIQADGREGLGVGQGARWRVPAQSGERGGFFIRVRIVTQIPCSLSGEGSGPGPVSAACPRWAAPSSPTPCNCSYTLSPTSS